MATKTIKTNVTIHKPGKGHVPFKIDPTGVILSGKYSPEAVPPGTPVELDEDEADAILERHGGEEVKSDAPAPASQNQGNQPQGKPQGQ